MSTDPRPPAGDPRAPLGLTVVLAHLDVSDVEDVLRSLAGRLLDAGAVTVDFPEALQRREQTYPTGLPTPIPTAIPHADPEHVVRPGLALATLTRPVPFGEMGAAGGSVDVRLVAMPLLADAGEHLAALQRLMGLLRDETAVAELLEMPDDEALRERAAVLLAGALPSPGTGAAGREEPGAGRGEPGAGRGESDADAGAEA